MALNPSDLLEQALRSDPARPFVTFYDDATGERIELSVVTFANWVAKTANMLVDGVGAVPGQVLRLDLPRHWLTPVWVVAGLATGLVVALEGDPSEADVAVVGPAGIAPALGAGDVVALSLRPMAAAFGPGELPGQVLDYAREVPGYGDRFASSAPAGKVRAGGHDLGFADLAALADQLADRCGLDVAGRLLVSGSNDPLDELLATAVVPLLRAAGVVLVVGADEARTEALAGPERVTARLAGPREAADGASTP